MGQGGAADPPGDRVRAGGDRAPRLCSGRDPAGSWDLHCLVRERLITFIQGLDGGRFLPRRRVELVDAARPDGGGGGHPDEAAAYGDGVVPDRDWHHVR